MNGWIRNLCLSSQIYTLTRYLSPDSSISDSEISLSGYTLVREDRKNKRGGGTAIYVRDGIPYTHRPDLSIGGNETCWVEINRVKCKKLLVSSVYRPPDIYPDLLITGLNESLEKLPKNCELVVLLGDFNIDVLAKSTDNFSYKLKQKMQRFATSNHLEQLISSPTRISEKASTAIDLIFTNISHRIVDHGVTSDHFLLYCSNLVYLRLKLERSNTVPTEVTLKKHL